MTTKQEHARQADRGALVLLEKIKDMDRIPMENYLSMNPPEPPIIAALAWVALAKYAASHVGKKAAEARHNKPGGTRDMHAAICAAWASGKYSSRDICAEQEAGAIGMSFSAARKALRGTPDSA